MAMHLELVESKYAAEQHDIATAQRAAQHAQTRCRHVEAEVRDLQRDNEVFKLELQQRVEELALKDIEIQNKELILKQKDEDLQHLQQEKQSLIERIESMTTEGKVSEEKTNELLRLSPLLLPMLSPLGEHTQVPSYLDLSDEAFEQKFFKKQSVDLPRVGLNKDMVPLSRLLKFPFVSRPSATQPQTQTPSEEQKEAMKKRLEAFLQEYEDIITEKVRLDIDLENLQLSKAVPRFFCPVSFVKNVYEMLTSKETQH